MLNGQVDKFQVRVEIHHPVDTVLRAKRTLENPLINQVEQHYFRGLICESTQQVDQEVEREDVGVKAQLGGKNPKQLDQFLGYGRDLFRLFNLY